MDHPSVRMLLTGFVPFPRGERGAAVLPENPSETLARALPEVAESTVVLPVSWRHTVPALHAALSEHTHWLGLGLSSRVQRPTLETVALNIAHAQVADNEGVRLVRRRLEPDGELAEEVGFDPLAAQQAVRDAGGELDLSHHAGTYLCNSVLYAALRRRRAGALQQAAFVHLPPVTVAPPLAWAEVVTVLARWLRTA